VQWDVKPYYDYGNFHNYNLLKISAHLRKQSMLHMYIFKISGSPETQQTNDSLISANDTNDTTQ